MTVCCERQILFGSNIFEMAFNRIDGDVKLDRDLLVRQARTAQQPDFGLSGRQVI